MISPPKWPERMLARFCRQDLADEIIGDLHEAFMWRVETEGERKARRKYVLESIGSLKPSNDELWMLKEDLKQLKPRLDELTQRTLIIHGTQDELVPYANVSYMKKEFSHVDSLKVITIENENHFIVWTQEKLIKNAIVD